MDFLDRHMPCFLRSLAYYIHIGLLFSKKKSLAPNMAARLQDRPFDKMCLPVIKYIFRHLQLINDRRYTTNEKCAEF